MNVCVTTRTTVGVLVASLVVLLLTSTLAEAGECGPNADGWVTGCPAGDDEFDDTGALVGLSVAGQPINLILSGPTTIHRELGVSGRIGTEIISMSLTDISGTIMLTAGAGPSGTVPTPNGIVLNRSFGEIVEREADPAKADSSFEVYFEVDLGDGYPLYNYEPVPVRTVIREVPPETEYYHVHTSPIALYTNPYGEGEPVAYLVTANHDTRAPPPPPPPENPTVSQWGMVALVLLLLAGIAIKFGRRRVVAKAA